MPATTDVIVPDIGDFKDIPIIEVLVAAGDTVAVGDSIVTLESDKSTMDVPADRSGVVTEVLVGVGDRVSQGSLLLRIASGEAGTAADASATTPSPAPAAAPDVASAAAAASVSAPAVSAVQAGGAHTPAMPTGHAAASASAVGPVNDPHDSPARTGQVHASPSVRGLARELGVDMRHVRASGAKGRITRDDVLAHVKTAMQSGIVPGRTPALSAASSGGGLDLLPWPKVDFARFGEIELQPLSRIKKISGQNLARNWAMIPHVTNFDEADITALEDFRNQINRESERAGGHDAKLTLVAFLIKAAASTLQRFPTFNASLDGENLVLKRYCHIGFAADTPAGLMVPVIRDADRKGILQIAAEVAELARRARDGKLAPGDMTGGCFTVSSLGGVGGTGFTPIINAPEVAILGVTRASMKPVWDGTAFVPRLILPLALSWDHRVVDGVAAAHFLVHLAKLLADFRRVML